MNQEKEFFYKPEASQEFGEETDKELSPMEPPYQEISRATENLSERIEQGGLRIEEVRGFCNTIFQNMGEFEKSDFFEKLPLALKLAKLRDSYSLHQEESVESLEAGRQEEDKAKREIGALIGLVANNGEVTISNGIIFDIYHKNRSIENLDPEKASMLLEATARAFLGGNIHQELALERFFEQYAPQFQKIAASSKDFTNNYEEVKSFFSASFVEMHMAYNIQGEEGKRRGFLFRGEGKEAMEWLEDALGKYQLPPKEILSSWLSHQEDVPQIGENIARISALEAKEPGIAKFLYQTFGIRNFERYPEEALLALSKEYENLEKPYGVLINPTNDYNGAFSGQSWKCQHLFDQLQEQGYALRIMEAEGKLELAKRLVRLDRHYGPTNKISFAIIGGHGTEDSIQFGGEDRMNKLYTSDLAGSGAKKAPRFFEETPTIVLVSCSTGADRGIGQKLSEVMNAKVIAPDIPSNIEEIKVRRGSSGLEFDVEFIKKQSKRAFVGGRKIK